MRAHARDRVLYVLGGAGAMEAADGLKFSACFMSYVQELKTKCSGEGKQMTHANTDDTHKYIWRLFHVLYQRKKSVTGRENHENTHKYIFVYISVRVSCRIQKSAKVSGRERRNKENTYTHTYTHTYTYMCLHVQETARSFKHAHAHSHAHAYAYAHTPSYSQFRI